MSAMFHRHVEPYARQAHAEGYILFEQMSALYSLARHRLYLCQIGIFVPVPIAQGFRRKEPS